MKLGQFDKHVLENSRKKSPAAENLRVFSLTLKTTFWMVNLSQGGTQPGPFSPRNQGIFFLFSKKGRGGLPPPPSPP